MTAHWTLPERRARVRRSVRLDGSVWTTDKDGIVPALLSAEVRLTELAGETIQTVLTQAPGKGAPIGGVKVIAKSGWFAARPSGTEDIYKIYAESFRGADHLRRMLEEAQTIVGDALAASQQSSGIPSEPILKGSL